jgi:hypothetical protein
VATRAPDSAEAGCIITLRRDTQFRRLSEGPILSITLDKLHVGYRPMPQCNRRHNAEAASCRCATAERVRRRVLVLEALACLLPQHGPGRKHLRPIQLQPWQEALIEGATEEFVRGLIDSDGCRVVANDRGVRSVRYHFSNPSDDVRNLFCAALDELSIPWT